MQATNWNGRHQDCAVVVGRRCVRANMSMVFVSVCVSVFTLGCGTGSSRGLLSPVHRIKETRMD